MNLSIKYKIMKKYTLPYIKMKQYVILLLTYTKKNQSVRPNSLVSDSKNNFLLYELSSMLATHLKLVNYNNNKF